MAFSPRNGSARDEPMSAINVTPFVDVVLVLLIIFMITAGVFDFGLEIDVPRTREIATTQQDHPFINVTADGAVYYNTEPIIAEDIPARVREDAAAAGDSEEGAGVFVRAHRTVPWEVIAPIVEACGRAGLEVNMVTKPLERVPEVER